MNIKLENNKVVLKVNLAGGAYSDFHLKDMPINPLNWYTKDPKQPPFMGHFLCFDRWGPPTDGEKANGFDHHGEATTEHWEILDKAQKEDALSKCTMRCKLPMGGLELTRKIELSRSIKIC